MPLIMFYYGTHMEQELLGRTYCLFSFDMAWTALKKLRGDTKTYRKDSS
jgi:hypothetical protein